MMANRTLVNLDDLVMAYEWVSSDGPIETAAHVSRRDGSIHWQGDGVEEELPEDIEDETRYVQVPHQRDLDLGSHLALRFAARQLSDADYEQVGAIFGQRGAFGRFKALLDRRGKLQLWYDYQEQALTVALREWCEESGLELSEKRREP
jgi:hypothetical protein